MKTMSKHLTGQGNPKSQEVYDEIPHLLSDRGRGGCKSVSSKTLHPAGLWKRLALLFGFVGFLFSEPDVGGFRSISLKIPELQVFHVV